MFTELMQTPAPFFLPYLYQGKCKSKQLLIHSYPLMRPAFCGAKSVVSLISACKQRLISHTFFFFFEMARSKHMYCTHPPAPCFLAISQMLHPSGYDCIYQPQNRLLPYLIKDESFLSGTSKLA